jgi:GH35 family endo-1,4-beta-xylanase
MKTKNIITVLLVSIILASCAPAATVVPTETAVPTFTDTPVPTVTATVTPTPVSYIEGLNNVPKPDNNFVEQVISKNYLEVMGVSREEVNIVYAKHTDANGQEFAAMIDSVTGVPLAIYQGKWQTVSLSFLGKQNGIVMGTDSREDYDFSEMKVMSTFSRAFIGIGNAWNDNEPAQGQINAQEITKSVKLTNDLKINGVQEFVAAALFPGEFPLWLMDGKFSKDELREIMKKRIRYIIEKNPEASLLYVINEPYLPSNINPDRSKYDVFYHAWGNYDYITEAFRYAKEISGDKLKLIYNDSDNHYSIGQSSQASRQIVEMLHREGLIDYVGMQMHIGEWRVGAFDELMIPQMPKEIEFYKKIGVPVLITELSYQPDGNYVLSDYKMTLSKDEFEKRLSHVFGEVFRIAIESDNVQGILIWGPTDRSYKSDNVNWYSIFDEHGQPKQSYYIVLKTLYEGIK